MRKDSKKGNKEHERNPRTGIKLHNSSLVDFGICRILCYNLVSERVRLFIIFSLSYPDINQTSTRGQYEPIQFGLQHSFACSNTILGVQAESMFLLT